MPLPSYDPSAAFAVLGGDAISKNAAALTAARDETMADVDLLASGGDVPAEKQPLDSGFINWPEKLLADLDQNGDDSLVGKMEACAARLKSESDAVVSLGIGGSYMGLRAIEEALLDPYHNELTRDARGGVPRLYYGGFNLDNDSTAALLRLLSTCQNADELLERWSLVVISKSGGTLETAASFRIFRDAIEAYYGGDSDRLKQLVVPVTGASGKLHSLSEQAGYVDEFAIPDGIGGRFSVLTPVGLLPAAAVGVDIRALLAGARDMTLDFATKAPGENAVLDYVGVGHTAEVDHGMTIRLLSTWGDRLEAFGFWYDQLLSESLGKQEKGATPITGVQTRDLHSRGQQHQEGRRDKLITNVFIKQPSGNAVHLPTVDDNRDLDQLNRFAGRPMQEFLDAAFAGTNKAYADDTRPTADLTVDTLDAYTLGALFQFLMLATVAEGRLIDINPFGQPGVEAYKKNMVEILSR